MFSSVTVSDILLVVLLGLYVTYDAGTTKFGNFFGACVLCAVCKLHKI